MRKPFEYSGLSQATKKNRGPRENFRAERGKKENSAKMPLKRKNVWIEDDSARRGEVKGKCLTAAAKNKDSTQTRNICSTSLKLGHANIPHAEPSIHDFQVITREKVMTRVGRKCILKKTSILTVSP